MIPLGVTVATLLAGCLVVRGQGTGLVDFNNDRAFSTPADRLVREPWGAPLVGTNYLAQLYYGPSGASASSLNPVTAAPAAFRDATHTSPGTWSGGYRRLDGFTTGQYVTLQVRVWDGTVASTYEDAAAVDFLGTSHGVSEPFLYLIPSISGLPEFFFMEEFRGFTLVPEPSVALFAMVGIAGLYFWRKRTK